MYRAAARLFSGGLVGKVAGLGREVILAALYGTQPAVAALRVAQTALYIPVNFFVSDTLNAGFIPLYTRQYAESREQAHMLFAVVFLALTSTAVLLSVGLYVAAPVWTGLLAPGFDSASAQLATAFARITAVSLPFVVLGALFSYLEMANRSYTLASFRATVQSAGVIAGTLAAYHLAWPELLAWGFTAAHVVFVLWAVVLLGRRRMWVWPERWVWRDARAGLGSLWRLMRPLLLLPVMLQGTIAVERAVASLLGTPVVAGLDYARYVTETGQALLAVPLGLAGLATLSGVSPGEARDRLVAVLPPVLLLTLPFSVFLAVHSGLVVQVLYGRGAFDASSVTVTSSVLMGLSAGFWAHVVGYVLIKALNAQMRNREVLVIMAVALGLQSAANVLLYRHLGPLTLGASASIYGLVLLVLTARAFRIGRAIGPHIAALVAGAVIYLPLASLIPQDGVVHLAAALLVFLGFWLAWAFAVPVLRETLVRTLARVAPRWT